MSFWHFFCTYIWNGLIKRVSLPIQKGNKSGYQIHNEYDYNAIQVALQMLNISKFNQEIIFGKCMIIISVIEKMNQEKQPTIEELKNFLQNPIEHNNMR